jgi:hypothetical protein
MEATAGKYVVEVEMAYITPAVQGWTATFDVIYNDELITFRHPFNYPYIVEDHRKCLDNGDHDAARQVLMDELWIEIDEKVAAYLDDLHEAENIITPRQKRDARYEAEN